MWDAYKELDELSQRAADASEDYRVLELARHFPGLAPALRLVHAHFLDTPLDRVGRCCSADEAVTP